MGKHGGRESTIEKLEKIIDEVVEQREAAWADAEKGRVLVRGWEAAVGDESASFRFGRALIAWAEEGDDGQQG